MSASTNRTIVVVKSISKMCYQSAGLAPVADAVPGAPLGAPIDKGGI